MVLYHGSIYEFDTVDVERGQFNKDFGRGFYTSRDIGHSESLALRNKRVEEERFLLRGEKKLVKSWLYTFEFDEANLDSLNVKGFAEPDREWLRFVILNRETKRRVQEHSYDIVIGPTANDNTRAAIQSFMPPTRGQMLSERNLDALIMLLEPERLPLQYFFGTQHAADLLEFKNRRIVL